MNLLVELPEVYFVQAEVDISNIETKEDFQEACAEAEDVALVYSHRLEDNFTVVPSQELYNETQAKLKKWGITR